MTYKDWDSPSWRDDTGLESYVVYKKKWAAWPIICSGGEKVWLRHYYSRYRVWGHKSDFDGKEYHNHHTDFIENVSEAEYIVRKLAENL